MPALAFALVLLVTSPATAATIVLDFAEEALGQRGNSFTSAECGCVTFTEWSGTGELAVIEFEGGRALVVGDQGGDLLLDFLVPVASIRLEFGGDSPSPAVEWKPAVLVGRSADGFIGVDSEVPNSNNAIDQELVVVTAPPPANGPPIEQALFSFVQLGEHMPLSPFVGRITVRTIPEPGLIGLLALALGVILRGREQVRHAAGLALLVSLALLGASPATGATIVLDFEEETFGNLGPSFVSAECGCVELFILHGNTDLHIVRDDAEGNVLLSAPTSGARRCALSWDTGGREVSGGPPRARALPVREGAVGSAGLGALRGPAAAPSPASDTPSGG